MRPRRGVTFAASPVFPSQGREGGIMFRGLTCSDATTSVNEGRENYFASNETFVSRRRKKRNSCNCFDLVKRRKRRVRF